MSILKTLDRVMSIAASAERGRRSDALVSEIADGLATSGEYVTRVDRLPTEQVVDFNWAARQAGRSLGIRVRVEVEFHGVTSVDGFNRVRIVPVKTLH